MKRNLAIVGWAGAALLGLAACDDERAGDAAAGPSAAASVLLLEAPEEDDDEGPADAADQHRARARAAGERVAIAAGTFLAGSTPGDNGRDPVLEPALLSVTLEEFEIDRLPYPNDPTKPPLTGVPRQRAAQLCEQAGGRLCTELEWEHACKGPEQQLYAGAARWEPSCAKAPETCATAAGVLAMGGAMREWTASDVQPIKDLQPQAAAVRGAAASAAAVDHRCAHRTAVAPASSAADLGFRCCYGKANSAVIESPKWQATFRRIDFSVDRLKAMLGSVKRLSALAGEEPKYFREEAAVDTVKRRGEAWQRRPGGEPDGGVVIPPATHLGTAPLLWSPVPGEEILLVTGQAGKSTFIVAFHRLPGDRYRVGSTLILEGEPGPVVFAYNQLVRRKLRWAICWDCYGETGNITYRQDNRVVITHE